MIKIVLIVVCCFAAPPVFAQAGDFIVVKKNNFTVRTFFTGSMVRFKTVGGQWFSGRVVHINNDSLFFREVIVQQVPTPWGVPRLDTLTTFTRKIHYNDIVGVPRRKESFTYIKNGTLLMIAGGGYIGLNLINSAHQHYTPFGKENRKGMLIACGAFVAGKALQKLRKPYLIMGKKYQVRYIKA